MRFKDYNCLVLRKNGKVVLIAKDTVDNKKDRIIDTDDILSYRVNGLSTVSLNGLDSVDVDYISNNGFLHVDKEYVLDTIEEWTYETIDKMVAYRDSRRHFKGSYEEVIQKKINGLMDILFNRSVDFKEETGLDPYILVYSVFRQAVDNTLLDLTLRVNGEDCTFYSAIADMYVLFVDDSCYDIHELLDQDLVTFKASIEDLVMEAKKYYMKRSTIQSIRKRHFTLDEDYISDRDWNALAAKQFKIQLMNGNILL